MAARKPPVIVEYMRTPYNLSFGNVFLPMGQ